MTPRITWLLVGSALLGLLLGLMRGPGAVPADAAGLAGEWQIPAGASLLRHDAADLGPSLSMPWRGRQSATSADGSGAKPAPEWRLLGIVYDPEATALVDDGQGKILRLRAGDALADGSRVTAIQANRVRLERDGCSFERGIHLSPDQLAAARSTACPTQ